MLKLNRKVLKETYGIPAVHDQDHGPMDLIFLHPKEEFTPNTAKVGQTVLRVLQYIIQRKKNK